jgi:uncharacterized protein (TIGR02594 family)
MAFVYLENYSNFYQISVKNKCSYSKLKKANSHIKNFNNIPRSKNGKTKINLPNSKKTIPKVKPTKKAVKKHTTKKSTKKVTTESKSKGKCKCLSPSWMVIAKKEMNKKIQRNKNQAKKGNNPTIMDYHNTTNIFSYDNRGERVSWCGTYVNYVMKVSGYKTFSTSFRAKDWAKYGKKVSIPIYGSIGVKSRKGGGHVAFVMGVDNVKKPKYVYMLGGNQWGYSNNISWGTKTRKNGKSYIKSVLFPSRYKLSDWNLGFYVPNNYCTDNCKLKKYSGKFIISSSDGN